MSALGDYIHLITKNYLEYGTSRREKGNTYQHINTHLLQRTAKLQSVSQKTLDILKLRIASDSETQKQRDKMNLQNIWQEHLDQIYKDLAKITTEDLMRALQFSNYAGDGGFEKNKNKAVFQPSNDNYRELAIRNKGKLKANQIIKEYMDNIKKINEIIDKINKDGFADNNQINRINELYATLPIEHISLPHAKKGRQDVKSSYGKLQEQLNDLEYLNWIGNVSGAFGEHLLLSASDVAWGQAINGANKIIEQKIVGQEKTEIKIDSNLISKDLTSHGFKLDKDGHHYIIAPTQDKVDVQIIVNGEDVFASAKAYRDFAKHNATLQSDISLLYPLTFLNQLYDNFGNHWLNMHAANKKELKDDDINNADLVLSQELAYEALVIGNPFKQGITPANLFIAIERGSGRVAALNIKDILLKKFNWFNFNPYINNIHIKNEYDDSIKDRIEDILLQTHKLKTTVTYNISKAMNWT